jgi:hypothetical protein
VPALVTDPEPTDPAFDQDPRHTVGELAAHGALEPGDAEPPVRSGLEQRVDSAIGSGGQRQEHGRIVIT